MDANHRRGSNAMSLRPKPQLTPEDYLALERGADFKSEYFAGEIFAMTGASESHHLIAINTVAEIRQQLKKRPCKLYANDCGSKLNQPGFILIRIWLWCAAKPNSTTRILTPC